MATSDHDFHGTLPAGRYVLGDPGPIMRTGLLQEALEARGGRTHAVVEIEGAHALIVRPSAGVARYPNTGLLNRSAYDCESGLLGIVHESLAIRSRDIVCLGSGIRIVGEGVVSMVDGELLVSDAVHPALVHIDTVRDRGRRPARAALPLAA